MRELPVGTDQPGGKGSERAAERSCSAASAGRFCLPGRPAGDGGPRENACGFVRSVGGWSSRPVWGQRPGHRLPP